MHPLLKTALSSLGLLTATYSSREQDLAPATPVATATSSNLASYSAAGKKVVR
ncbi:hypothetical protein [Hymenobacter terrenus]|uniref:hypothetical protein n=1 Tax=Hymenobacter terrenus TaxID=1629124 RepID=UPI000B0E05EC|nr:hypothetical protein [Hymenobacter terrenus]